VDAKEERAMCVTGVEADSGQAQRDQFSPYPNGRRPGLQSHARDLTDNVSPHGGGDRACSARSPFTEHGPFGGDLARQEPQGGPIRRASRLPASPCSQTPQAAAWMASAPRASRPAISPASTSPEPDVPRPYASARVQDRATIRGDDMAARALHHHDGVEALGGMARRGQRIGFDVATCRGRAGAPSRRRVGSGSGHPGSGPSWRVAHGRHGARVEHEGLVVDQIQHGGGQAFTVAHHTRADQDGAAAGEVFGQGFRGVWRGASLLGFREGEDPGFGNRDGQAGTTLAAVAICSFPAPPAERRFRPAKPRRPFQSTSDHQHASALVLAAVPHDRKGHRVEQRTIEGLRRAHRRRDVGVGLGVTGAACCSSGAVKL
jgi:hypothetical protein